MKHSYQFLLFMHDIHGKMYRPLGVDVGSFKDCINKGTRYAKHTIARTRAHTHTL
jgi:hypothetical protein